MVEPSVVKESEKEAGDLFLPPGFRFHPTDEEIITSYLLLKFLNPSFSPRAMGEVNLNKCEPWDLPSRAKMGEKEWYFFCHKDRKYPTGMRTNRATKEGYWKATGKDREIYDKHGHGELVGMKKTLVFYMGRAPRGSKTDWVMHEYRLIQGNSTNNKNANLRFNPKDEWAVCKVHHKKGEAKKPAAGEEYDDCAETPNVSSVEAGDGADEFLDSMMDDPSFYFKSTAAGTLLAGTTTTTNAAAPYNADYYNSIRSHSAAVLGTSSSSLVDQPTYGGNSVNQLAGANSTTVPVRSSSSSSYYNEYQHGMGSYNYSLHHQAMTVKALALGGRGDSDTALATNFAAGSSSSSAAIAGRSLQQNNPLRSSAPQLYKQENYTESYSYATDHGNGARY